MARRYRTPAALAISGVAIVLGVAGCTFAGATPEASPSSRPTPTGSATSTPSAVSTLRPDLSASENLAFFDSVNLGVITANAAAGGGDFIDGLAAAGFDKSQMQVTADRTTVDLQADSVQFSVLLQGECLVGQYGPASGGYHGAVRPMLGTGACLVGETRPIDW